MATLNHEPHVCTRIMHTRIKTKRQKLKPYKCNGFVGILELERSSNYKMPPRDLIPLKGDSIPSRLNTCAHVRDERSSSRGCCKQPTSRRLEPTEGRNIAKQCRGAKHRNAEGIKIETTSIVKKAAAGQLSVNNYLLAAGSIAILTLTFI